MKQHFFSIFHNLISVILEKRKDKETCVNSFSIKSLHVISATKNVAIAQ